MYLIASIFLDEVGGKSLVGTRLEDFGRKLNVK